MKRSPVARMLVCLAAIMLALPGLGDMADDTFDGANTTFSYLSSDGKPYEVQFGLMEPTFEELQMWDALYRNAPAAAISPEIMAGIHEAPTGQLYSLLDRLEYTPSERYQGYCGNCWAWAGTGVMEIALFRECGIKDRLSVQYLNSNYNGGSGGSWACCGGWLDYLASFYRDCGKAVPWSNENASWQDTGVSCGSLSSSVPASSIEANPSYTITSIHAVTIPTYEVDSETTVDNLKNVLHQGKAIWFAYFLPNSADWSDFMSDFWADQNESAVWDPSYEVGITGSSSNGHAVLCLGYNDTDPENRYWIMLNCWGITDGRPNGLFLVDMDMNYSCWYNYDGWYPQQSFYWMTLDIAYDVDNFPTVTNSVGATEVTASSATLNGELIDTGGEDPNVYIYWGDNDGGNSSKEWDHVVNLSSEGIGFVCRDLCSFS